MKRDFLCLSDLSCHKVWSLLELASSLKHDLACGHAPRLLKGKSLAMVFQKPSLRTRVSFEMGMQQLGGHALYIAPDEIQLGRRESAADVARVLSGYVDGIMARVFAHEDVLALARWASVPVINGLSDYNHPCQGMADLLTIYERLARLEGVTLAYVGDGNNVLHTLLIAGAIVGMNVIAATPEPYPPSSQVVARAQRLASNKGTRIRVLTDPEEAVREADVIYTDTWTSMGQEAEAAARLPAFRRFQVNTALLEKAPSGAGVMHCLPAHRGLEITDDVVDGPQSWIFQQAENRLHAQKAILVDLLRN